MDALEEITCAYCGQHAPHATEVQAHLHEAAIPRDIQVVVPLCGQCRPSFLSMGDTYLGTGHPAPAEAQEESIPVGVV